MCRIDFLRLTLVSKVERRARDLLHATVDHVGERQDVVALPLGPNAVGLAVDLDPNAAISALTLDHVGLLPSRLDFVLEHGDAG